MIPHIVIRGGASSVRRSRAARARVRPARSRARARALIVDESARPMLSRVPLLVQHTARCPRVLTHALLLHSRSGRGGGGVQMRCFCDGGPTSFYSSQSGVTVELPTGIHLHDVGLQGVRLPANESERTAWEKILTSYASSDRIRTVQLPGALAADETSGAAWAESLLGLDTAAAISDIDGATSSWSRNSIVAVTAAVGKVDGLDPDESVEAAVGAAAEVHGMHSLALAVVQPCSWFCVLAAATFDATVLLGYCRLATPDFEREH